MPRPPRCRNICSLPEFWSFSAEEDCTGEIIKLTLDELETIRLLDKEQLTQEECALQMNVARTTVTAIYESARHKLASALLDGKRLVISGGSWQLKGTSISESLKSKGENIMRIAVTYENGEIFQHFGHTQQFKLYDVEDGKITKSEITDTKGQGHGALAGFLKCAGVDVLICGGIGGGAQMALSEAGIKLYGGASGKADDAVAALLAGNLNYNPDVKCDHHGEGHGHGGEHSCGGHHDHACGGHDHGDHACGGHDGHGDGQNKCGHGQSGQPLGTIHLDN